ncbi:adenylyl-sulfate kinase [Qipengyuania sp. MTN3-11]|uniref:adenylyl-sulfate kinase n=1 Tax=Qipengyuania sp. MTN3-11 TaxID=3056557 RepID=UPI0036F2DA28
MADAPCTEAFATSSDRTSPGADLLRFITCGSVDDGKSTLIGRLLWEAGSVPQDQMAAVIRDGEPDYSLLFDGLAAEREQGITIDVAYRYFATAKRTFIVADCPGHEQYTRNMVTGASIADCALILVDVRKGLSPQTHRHAFICHLLGIRRIVLAVTKMDLVGYEKAAFDRIAADFAAFAETIGLAGIVAVPVSGKRGDNVVHPSDRMGWHAGPSLLACLETVEIASEVTIDRPFRMPVQWVARRGDDFRGYGGLIASGTIAPGERVCILPSGRTTTVERIVAPEGDRDSAAAGESTLLTFAEELDCARGDVVACAADAPQIADQFKATLVWLAEEPLKVGRQYALKLATQTVTARVQHPDHVIDTETGDRLAAKTLDLNAIGVAEVLTDKPLVFEPYETNRTLGGFVLIDRLTQATVAAGMIRFSLRRSQNLRWQPIDVTREHHAAIKHQTPRVLWFTGLSGSGKSTIANAVEKRLAAMERHTFLLDGDNVRHGLNRDLGFTEADRIENIRRIGEVAKLMTDAGLIVLTAFISPFAAERRMVRAMFSAEEFVEIFVDTPLEVAEARDVKGLYRKARAGEIRNFTGIGSPYERPERADIVVDTVGMSAEEAADHIVARIFPSL